MPAIEGPSTRAPLTIAELSAMAFSRSSRPTISRTNDWRAGMSNAFTMPRHVARTKICHTRTWPLSVSAASVNGKSMDTVCVTTMTRCLLKRSATMPPRGERTKIGI